MGSSPSSTLLYGVLLFDEYGDGILEEEPDLDFDDVLGSLLGVDPPTLPYSAENSDFYVDFWRARRAAVKAAGLNVTETHGGYEGASRYIGVDLLYNGDWGGVVVCPPQVSYLELMSMRENVHKVLRAYGCTGDLPEPEYYLVNGYG